VLTTKLKMWQTWAGSRTEIHRAALEASDAVAEWSGYPSVVSGTVTLEGGLTQTIDGIDSLTVIHRTDLRSITQLWIDIKPSRDAYWEAKEEHRKLVRASAEENARRGEQIRPEEEFPSLSDASVALRFAWAGYGVRIEVTGDDRSRVVGLFDRLQQLLCERQALRHIDPGLTGFLVAFILANVGLLVGSWLPRAIGIAQHDGKWQVPEIAGPIIGAVVGIAVGLALYLLYPTLEVLDDSDKSRAERFGTWVLGGIAAIVLGLIASGIYDLAT
jgi:uncharacterized membrane protein YeaQ/YmgE (transglycosylase-associated protein family)